MEIPSIDYSLDVTCNHGYRSNPATVIATILHYSDRNPHREWDSVHMGAESIGTLQTRSRVQGRLEDQGEEYATAKRRLREFGTGSRWRFQCKDCGETFERRHDKFVTALEKLKHNGVSSVTIQALGRTL